jgi:hypothetical protein
MDTQAHGCKALKERFKKENLIRRGSGGMYFQVMRHFLRL